MQRFFAVVLVAMLLAGCGAGGGEVSVAPTVSTVAQQQAPAVELPPPPENRFIVMTEEGYNPEGIGDSHGVEVEEVYSDAVDGFTGLVPEDRVEELAADPRVISIEPDSIVTTNAQEIPSGIRRTQGTQSNSAAVNGAADRTYGYNVAVIDTGIDLTHPDLNVVGNMTFVAGTTNGNDDNGHGSHVAGIIGARDNTVGVVGMAPGVGLWALKALDSKGAGYTSGIISALNWVAANASKRQIKVVNLSLGGPASATLDAAVTNCVNKGVIVVVAAGNSNVNAGTQSPARCSAAITVSALTDTDGLPGSRGPTTSVGGDDTIASFSNFGSVVDCAAPGVIIRSTYKRGSYATMSGTSMAAPHVAGAAILYLHRFPTATPAAVETAFKAAYSSSGSRNSTYALGKGQATADVNVFVSKTAVVIEKDWNGASVLEGGYKGNKGSEPIIWARNL